MATNGTQHANGAAEEAPLNRADEVQDVRTSRRAHIFPPIIPKNYQLPHTNNATAPHHHPNPHHPLHPRRRRRCRGQTHWTRPLCTRRRRAQNRPSRATCTTETGADFKFRDSGGKRREGGVGGVGAEGAEVQC